MRKNLKTFLFIAVLSLGISDVFSKDVIFGGKDGWPVFQTQKNITKGKGRYGYDCIQLSTNSFEFDQDTDLLIDFENPACPIAKGEYQIETNNLKISNQSIMAKGAGLSRNMGGMNVKGKSGTFFGSQGFMGSFSIEFWLCPSIAENGEVIINWETSRNSNGRLVYQLLNCSFSSGHLEWTLSNFFDSYVDKNGSTDVVLRGKKTIIPDTWTYHVLSYDCETGILEYLVNGTTEDIKYITSTGWESGEIFLVNLGAPTVLEFCNEYTGKIDDIRILRRAYSSPDYQSAEKAGKVSRMLFNPTGGRFVSKPIVVSTGSKLNLINTQMDIPSQTEVSFYVRAGDNYFNWTDSYPKWVPVVPGQPIKNVTGMYFQLACDIYPDGDGAVTPTITQILMNFEELPLPVPPYTVKAIAGNKSVTLSWNSSVDNNTGGYYIYYGTRPGEYLGRFALEGSSPINVGNRTSFKITGLENGKIYYFAVASWSLQDDRIIGPLSKEVYARPLSRLQ